MDIDEHWHRHPVWITWADWTQAADAELQMKIDAAMRGLG